ncbi:MAG: flagellar hook protein FlgE [Proteobacteria bacterium]|nr:flagellar hook protein FlgE [Pseudomonadota bacterium]
MSFQQGLSGLNAAAKNLDVIGNNVANSNTTGFKQSVANFGDVFAASLGGGDGAQVGIGTTLASVAQQFSQGNITVTNNPLDVAINGKGFFRMSDNGAITFTRNGQFAVDKTGYIVDSGGQNLTGFQAIKGKIVPGVLVDLQMSTADLPPTSTVKVTVGANLAATDSVLLPAGFLPTDPTTFNFSTATSVIDSLGQSHTATMYFNKSAVDLVTKVSSWVVNVYVDGAAANNLGVTTLNFDAAGKLITLGASAPNNLVKKAVLTNGATDMTVTMDYGQMTQFGSGFGVNTLEQDGFGAGQLSGYSIGADGIILGRYTNGQTDTLGQVALANFSNSQGLKPLGESKWGESASSGAALIGSPGSASLGALQSAAREDSNVDLTAELVNMITAQRIYQANAQSIKTQDAVLQTLVNLK